MQTESDLGPTALALRGTSTDEWEELAAALALACRVARGRALDRHRVVDAHRRYVARGQPVAQHLDAGAIEPADDRSAHAGAEERGLHARQARHGFADGGGPGFVQPLAGEWAARRALMETLTVPTGYGVEIASLIDTYRRLGLGAIAQVDLGARAHRHQRDHDLAVMAAELLAVVHARQHGEPQELDVVADELHQFTRDGGWRTRPVPLVQRPPAVSQSGYEDVDR